MIDALERLRRVMVEEFDLEATAVVPEADLFKDLDIDSIDAIDMLARLRELTGTEISAEALKNVRTVGDLIALLDAN